MSVCLLIKNADVLLNKEYLIDTVIAQERLMVAGGEAVVRGTFER